MACRGLNLAKARTGHGETDHVLGLELSKQRRTLKAMLTDLIIKENIL